MRLSRTAAALATTLFLTTAAAAPSADPADAGRSAASAASDACGEVMEKPDGTPWECTFVDEFAGSTLDRTK